MGERASAEEFLARRAQLVLERIGTRQAAVRRTVRGIRWRPWVGVVTVVAAFLFGLLIDRIGGGSSINLLAPPVFALVAWNVSCTSGCSCVLWRSGTVQPDRCGRR